MMRKTFFKLFIFSLALSGCAQLPKTQKEFRKVVSTYPSGHIEKFESNRKFDDVKKELNEFARQCYNMQIGTTIVRSTHQSTFTQNFYGNWSSKNRPGWETYEIRMQGHPPVVGAPEGGQYLFVADFKPTAKGSVAEMTYVTEGALPDYHADIKEILEGKTPKCKN